MAVAAVAALLAAVAACGNGMDDARTETRAQTLTDGRTTATDGQATISRGRTRGRTSPQSWRGFRAGRWPGAAWRPYATSSPFNQPIPQRVRVHPRSAGYVATMLEWGAPSTIAAGAGGTDDDYAHPTYWAQRDDPVYSLRPSTDWGHPQLRGMRIRIPRRAIPAPGDDGHMTVVQPDGWEYDFWRAQRPSGSGGILRYASGARLRIDGSGVDGGATAADFGNLAGIIRAPELAAGRIDHALFLVTRCAGPGTGYGHGVHRARDENSGYVRPAGGGGARCPRGVDAPPLGARVQLAMGDAEIAALPIAGWKRAVLTALARYGAYIGDTGGPGLAVQIESSLTYTAFGRPDPLVKLGLQRRRLGDAAVSQYGDRYLFDIASGVDWQSRLRVVAPPSR